MPSITSLDEKLSDIVGSSKLALNETVNFTYNFSIDQNYKDFNYNEFNTNLIFDPMKIGFGYVLEDEHIGNQEYFKTKIDYTNKKMVFYLLRQKRNLISDHLNFII